jgi:hypothetical protein
VESSPNPRRQDAKTVPDPRPTSEISKDDDRKTNKRRNERNTCGLIGHPCFLTIT